MFIPKWWILDFHSLVHRPSRHSHRRRSSHSLFTTAGFQATTFASNNFKQKKVRSCEKMSENAGGREGLVLKPIATCFMKRSISIILKRRSFSFDELGGEGVKRELKGFEWRSLKQSSSTKQGLSTKLRYKRQIYLTTTLYEH